MYYFQEIHNSKGLYNTMIHCSADYITNEKGEVAYNIIACSSHKNWDEANSWGMGFLKALDYMSIIDKNIDK